MELYLRSTGFSLLNNFSICFHEMGSNNEWIKIRFADVTNLCLRVMGKYGLAHT